MYAYKEKHGSLVQSPPNTYARLSNYNQGFGRGPVAEIPQGTPSMAFYTVPSYCPSGPGPNYPPKYDALSHGQSDPSPGGYFNVAKAYPHAGEMSCGTKFVNRPCKGFVCGLGPQRPVNPTGPSRSS